MTKNLTKKFNWKLLAKIVFTFLGVGWVLSQIDVKRSRQVFKRGARRRDYCMYSDF